MQYQNVLIRELPLTLLVTTTQLSGPCVLPMTHNTHGICQLHSLCSYQKIIYVCTFSTSSLFLLPPSRPNSAIFSLFIIKKDAFPLPSILIYLPCNIKLSAPSPLGSNRPFVAEHPLYPDFLTRIQSLVLVDN